MPITNTRDVIPFVNELEKQIESVNRDIGSWLSERQKVLGYGSDIADIRFRSTGAFSRAEEALSELGNATSGVIALRGQRLKKVLDDLRKEVKVIAEEAVNSGGGGGGGFFDERITDEINNAVAGMSTLIPDGMKLDARIQEVTDLAARGGDLGNKDLIVPIMRQIQYLGEDQFILEMDADIKYVDGEVAIVKMDGDSVLTLLGKAAVANIEALDNGARARVTLPDIELGSYKLFFPAEVALSAWPREAMESVMGATISRTSPTFRRIAEFDVRLEKLQETMKQMQGQNWTADISLMKNHQDIIREAITPKGLHIEHIAEGKVNVSFSYTDHENLSHFVLERLDEETNSWSPYDGEQGIVTN
ncbi:hypothetical protein ACQR3P_29440 [Rhodococcus sp. IEGM1300]